MFDFGPMSDEVAERLRRGAIGLATSFPQAPEIAWPGAEASARPASPLPRAGLADLPSPPQAGSVPVPLPPARPAEFSTPEADLPAAGAQPIMAAPQSVPAPSPATPAAEEPGFFDKAMGAIRSTDGLLTNIGIGLMSTPGWGQAVAAGLKGHQVAQKDKAVTDLARAEFGLKQRKLAKEEGGENATVSALVRKGYSQQDATDLVKAAAAGNREGLQNALNNAFRKVPDAPAGFRDTTDGGLLPIPGGPQDLSTIKAQAEARDTKADKDEGGKITAQMEARRQAAPGLGLVEGSPEWRSFVGTGKIGRELDMTATDRKAINAAEDELPGIDSTIDTLKRARELNRQTFTGATSGVRGWLGTALPDGMVPDMIADPKGAAATREFGQIMSMEALKSMSQTLKGATTEWEMAKFLEIMGDPSTPPDIRERTIDRMAALAQRQRDLAQSRVTEMRDGTYYKRGGGAGSGETQTPATDPLSSARAAIAGGADRQAVIQRLLKNGINPKGL